MSIFNKLNITDVSISEKRILIRVEFNVEIHDGVILNPRKIDESIPTIKYALDHNAKSIVLISHLGRPNGRRVPEFSLKPIQPYLEGKLNREIIFIDDCISDEAINLCNNPPHGSIFLLENLRYYIEETEYERITSQNHQNTNNSGCPESTELEIQDNVKRFCHKLSMLGDIYIDDAFGTIHRNHSSLSHIELNTKVSGLLLSKELGVFNKILDPSSKPLLGIIGGDKIVDKITLLYALLDKVDNLIIYGDMAYTFLKIMHNISIGSTPFDEQGGLLVHKLLTTAQFKGVNLHFPIDCLISELPISDFSESRVISVYEGVPNNFRACDIGPETVTYFNDLIENSKSIIINGSGGLYKYLPFQKGTGDILKSIDKQTKSGTPTIGFGSDTEHMINKLATTDILTLLSTGHGAVIYLLAGNTAPAIAALNDKPNLDTLLMMYMFF